MLRACPGCPFTVIWALVAPVLDSGCLCVVMLDGSRTLGRRVASCDNTGDAVAVDDNSAIGQRFPVTTSSSRCGRITVRMEKVIGAATT